MGDSIMKIRAHWLTIGIAAMALSMMTPAAAQSVHQSDNRRIVETVVQADLVAIVTRLGHTLVSEKEFGDVSVLAKDSKGLLYILKGAVCEHEGRVGCLGLDVQVRYDADNRVTLEKVNLANQSYLASKIYTGPNEKGVQTVFVTNYMILDGGQRMTNIDTVVENMVDLGPLVSDIIWPKS
jgi:hypothetical protein